MRTEEHLAAGIAASRATPKPQARRGRRRPPVLAGLLLTAFAVFFVLPVGWLLLATTKTDEQLLNGNPLSFGSVKQLKENFTALMAFQDAQLWTWLGNSMLYSFAALIITLAVSIPAGYVLGLVEFRLRKPLLITTLVVMLMPATTLVIPLFLETNAMGLAGTAWSVILPFSFYPFGVYLTYIYFSTAVPSSLLSAARIDGCTEWQVFTRIAVPLAKPIVALVGFFGFVANWTNFFLPYVMLPGSDQYPAQVGLAQLLSSVPSFNPTVGAGFEVTRPELALAAVLTVAPVLIVFVFAQRALVSGMLAGATKE